MEFQEVLIVRGKSFQVSSELGGGTWVGPQQSLLLAGLFPWLGMPAPSQPPTGLLILQYSAAASPPPRSPPCVRSHHPCSPHSPKACPLACGLLPAFLPHRTASCHGRGCHLSLSVTSGLSPVPSTSLATSSTHNSSGPTWHTVMPASNQHAPPPLFIQPPLNQSIGPSMASLLIPIRFRRGL